MTTPGPLPVNQTASASASNQWAQDGTAQISSQLKSGYNHTVSAIWQAERQLHKSMFIYPIFLSADPEMEEPISGIPNQYIRGLNKLLPFLSTLVAKGLHAVILFGTLLSTHIKDNVGSMADSESGPIRPAIPIIRQAFPDLYVIADVSLCEYTDHGHSSVLLEDGSVDNEATVTRVSDMALSFARAGAHCVAPSDMSDGRIRAIKLKLLEARLEGKVAIMSYSAKYASCLYGPFREAIKSNLVTDEHKRYLLPPPARKLAHRVMLRDMHEGADMIIVKPAYADIISDAKGIANVPVAAMQVSGEYAMLHAAASAGVFDLKTIAFETTEVIVRAGADAILSYFTPDFLDWLS
ncbi:delta-aminolevulinic acid dehydratase [Nannizzia gypsea CBS 118893]|uniref:porphobilinogen synthase n=1 Tax=Arthroderma gypseum (strain ATCC MYA-4604 / CBS 118893) TaxID=535722 RepID=E4V0C6_ARTGP|nr:delta-aminolevulinic acid dehydratase [Nannizzia gypsea CBS 118893]EFR03063.1 delta-aminolevulinic acid dehydratase [Nannizzia gypsea CBS 118893]